MTDNRVFANAVTPYYQAGWSGILPVPPESKFPPPEGFTGADGIDTSPEQLVKWASNGFADYSIALRMPEGRIGIDVDHYISGEKVKTGADDLAKYEEKWGPLPATWISTARGSADGPGPAGIRLFQCPPRRYGTKLSGSIEIIQRHHRYAVVWPSVHTQVRQDSGEAAQYRWYRPDGTPAAEGEVPRPEDLPQLPKQWVDGLAALATAAGAAAADHASGESLLAELLLDDRTPCADISNAEQLAYLEVGKADAGSRHDTMGARVHHLIHLGATGHPGIGPVLGRLREHWGELTAGEDRDEEFHLLMLSSARKAVTATGVDQVSWDPCLLTQGFNVPGPAPIDNREDDDPNRIREPLPPAIQAPIAHSWQLKIGTWLFDPGRDTDQEIADAVLERVQPMLRYASDSGNTWLQCGPDYWERFADLTRRAVSETAILMPWGDPDLPAKKSDYTLENRQYARRIRMFTNGPASAVAMMMKGRVGGGWHPSTVRLADLDSEPEILWAGGKPYNLRASLEVPVEAEVGNNVVHLSSAGVTPAVVPTPHWDRFLEAVWPDEAIRRWAIRVLSISLTGYADAALPILLGPGGVGKTSVISLIMSVLGNYAHAANPKLISGESSHDHIIAELKGRRLSFIDETPSDAKGPQERLKRYTGGGQLTGDYKNQSAITFTPTHTLILTANDEPALSDEAVRRRARLIPCEGDIKLVERYRQAIGHTDGPIWQAEAPGVLAMLMREAAAWLADPSSALTASAPVTIRLRADEIAEQQDNVRMWLEDSCEEDPIGTRSSTLHKAYTGWCKDHNISPHQALKIRKWALQLKKLGVNRDESRSDGNYWLLRIRPDDFFQQNSTSKPVSSVAAVPPSPEVEAHIAAMEDQWRMNGGSQATSSTTENRSSDPVFVSSMEDMEDVSSSFIYKKEEESPERPRDSTIGASYRSDAPSSTTRDANAGLPAKTADFRSSIDPPEAVDPPQSPKQADVDLPEHRPPSPAVTPQREGALSPQRAEIARRAAEAKITKAEARAVLKAEQIIEAIAEASGEILSLPAVVDRAGHVIPITEEQAALVVRSALDRTEGALTVDVETSGYPVGHKEHKLRSVQLGDEHAAVVLDPITHAETIRTLLSEATKLHAHSATADLVPMAHAGLIDIDAGWSKMYDTVIPAKLGDPQSTGSDPGLKKLAVAVLGSSATAPSADEGREKAFKAGKWLTRAKADTPVERNGWAQIDTASETMLRYAASDVLDTAALARRLPVADTNVVERERIAEEMTARIADRGLRIDAEKVARLTEEHTLLREQHGAKVHDFGIDNPGSGQQVAVKLADLGTRLPVSDKGNPSVAEAVLTALARSETDSDAGQLARAVLDYRHSSTVLGLFLEPYRLLCELGDGRARPTVYTLGTDTGRMCLPTSHGLVTRKGFVKSDELRAGMETLDATGSWVRVTAVHRYEDQPVITLNSKGLQIAGTPEHRWVTSREHEAAYAKHSGQSTPARKLRALDDHPRLRVHLAPEIEPFDFGARTIPAETEGQRFAALVGMLITDGRCADSDVPEVGMRAYVYQTERKFLDEFRRVIPADAVMSDRVTIRDHHELRIRARWLRPRLEAAGLRTGALLKESTDLHQWVVELPIDELRAFFSACWLADGSLANKTLSCGSENLRGVLALAGYRLGTVVYTANTGRGGWSTKDRLMLRFRDPVISARKSQRSQDRSDVWCVTTETGTFTAVSPEGTVYLTGNSCVRPNFQQLPKKGGIRSLVCADEGHVFVAADFSGVEIRGAAALSQDPTLLAVLAQDRDLHAEVALQAFGPDDEASAKAGKPVPRLADRYIAKRAVFGRLYGGGIPTLAKQTGVSEHAMAAIVDSLDAMTPGLSRWSESIRQGVRRGNTQFQAYSGRIIHFPPAYPHKAPNYGIQGTCRELLVDALIRWRETRWGNCTLLPIHDEVLVQVPAEDAHEAICELVKCMGTELYGVKIVADPDKPDVGSVEEGNARWLGSTYWKDSV